MSTRTDNILTRVPGLEILGPMRSRYDTILSPAALAFLADLARRFGPRLADLLAARAGQQSLLESGATLEFMPETPAIRGGAGTVAPLPSDLPPRTVEVPGPVDRKVVIQPLNP